MSNVIEARRIIFSTAREAFHIDFLLVSRAFIVFFISPSFFRFVDFRYNFWCALILVYGSRL